MVSSGEQWLKLWSLGLQWFSMPIFTGRNEASHKEAFYLKKPRVYSTNYMFNGMELPILSELGNNVSDYWSSYFRLSQVGNSQIHLQNNLLEMFDNEKLMEAIPNRKIPSMGEERSLPHDYLSTSWFTRSPPIPRWPLCFFRVFS